MNIVTLLAVNFWYCFGEPVAALDATWWNRHAASISCSRPGYFVNAVDCHSFYRCVDRSTWDKPALQRYDFTCPRGMVFDPAVSVCTEPGSNGCADPWWPGANGGSNSDGGGFDSGPSSSSNSNSLDNLPPIFASSKGPDRGAGAWFERNKPANSNDRIDSGSGEKDSSSFNTPSSSERPSRPGFASEFNFGGGGGADPLDNEFGSPPASISDGNSGSSEPFNKPDSDSNSGSKECEPFCNNVSGGSNSRESKPSTTDSSTNSDLADWLFGSNNNDNKAKNKRPGGSEFDPWPSNNLGQGNRPSSANWGGASRPSSSDDPWRPTGPWGSSNTPDQIPPSRRNGSNSWWDPPYPAMPYHPRQLSPVGPPPPPEPWANPFRPRFPVYQIVAYPTWPGPYNRSPVLVIYSNSKKKK